MKEEQETLPETIPDTKPDEAASSIEEAVIEGSIEEEAAKRRGITRISFQGPLPPPELLQKYQEIQPDFPERILRLTEQEAEHRRKITNKAINIDGAETIIGQIFGLVVALAAFVTTGVLGYLDQPTAASILGGGSIIGLVAVFIKGRSQTEPNNNEKE